MEKETVENVEEIEETEVEELETTEEETTEDETETTEGEETETELEEWQKEDSRGDDVEKPVKFLKAKKKLKGVIAEQNDELERLRAENEALKKQKQEPETSKLKRPDPLDFDDDDEYNKALDEYNVNLFESRQNQKRQQESQQAILKQIEDGIDEHYERAEALIKESGISPERYREADAKLRAVFKSVFPDNGDIVADATLGRLGKGSEKVGYYIGNNEAARLKFQNLLIEDPTGIKAAMFLGAENNRLNNPVKRTTRAKAPGADVKGDSNVSVSEASLKKKYEKAHKAKNGQEAFNIKQQAKKAGINVSSW